MTTSLRAVCRLSRSWIEPPDKNVDWRDYAFEHGMAYLFNLEPDESKRWMICKYINRIILHPRRNFSACVDILKHCFNIQCGCIRAAVFSTKDIALIQHYVIKCSMSFVRLARQIVLYDAVDSLSIMLRCVDHTVSQYDLNYLSCILGTSTSTDFLEKARLMATYGLLVKHYYKREISQNQELCNDCLAVLDVHTDWGLILQTNNIHLMRLALENDGSNALDEVLYRYRLVESVDVDD